MGKRLRCRLGMHKWTEKKTADNQPYRACVNCGTEDVRGEGRSGSSADASARFGDFG